MNRRSFLQWLGIGAAGAVVAPHVVAEEATVPAPAKTINADATTKPWRKVEGRVDTGLYYREGWETYEQVSPVYFVRVDHT